MGIKSVLAKPLASYVAKSIEKQKVNALEDQQKIFLSLMSQAQVTEFGKEHNFNQINSHEEFKQAVPIRDYELFKPYIEKIKMVNKIF